MSISYFAQTYTCTNRKPLIFHYFTDDCEIGNYFVPRLTIMGRPTRAPTPSSVSLQEHHMNIDWNSLPLSISPPTFKIYIVNCRVNKHFMALLHDDRDASALQTCISWIIPSKKYFNSGLKKEEKNNKNA